MPSDEELMNMAALTIFHKTSLIHMEGSKAGRMTSELLAKVKEYLPNITDVYGTVGGFDSSADVNYIIITEDQTYKMLEFIKKHFRGKQTMIEMYNLKRVFLCVEKEDGEPLSSVKLKEKIIYAGA